MVEKEIEVINKLGLHARAASKLVKCCSGFQSTIQLIKREKTVDAKSIMGVLMLAATQGSRLTLRVDGDDAVGAGDAVTALFENYFGEGE